MIEFNACSSLVTPAMIRGILARVVDDFGKLPAKCLVHPAQMAAFDYLDVVDEKNPMAIPINVDVRELRTTIRFFSGNDEELCKISNLAIPLGFGEL